MAEHLKNGLSNRRDHSFTHHPSQHTQLNRGTITPVSSWKLYHGQDYNSLSQQNSLSRSASLPHPLTRGAPLHRPVFSARKLAALFWVQHEIPLLHRQHDDGDDAVEASPLDLAEGQQPLSAQCASDGSKCPSGRLSCKFLHETVLSRKATVLPEKVTPEIVETLSDQTTLTDDIFERLRYMQENQTKSMSVIETLRSELEDASSRLKELELSHDSAVNEIDGLLRRFRDNMRMSRRKEQEKIKSAFLHLRQEMEEEKNSGRLLKIQNKKLRKELLEANRTTTTAIEELEMERKGRELMEDICSELAREIGQDKAEFEELKREQAEASEKVKIERKMLKMAALWREDRVRQKLSEMQQELEGKNEALEDLNSKLEGFVKTVRRSGVGSLRQTLELLQFEEEKWSATDQNSESPNHETHPESGGVDDGRQSKERENHVGGEELAHVPSLGQNSEEEGVDHEEETTQEEEEEGSEWEYGDDVFTREEDDPTELEEGFLLASHRKLPDKISRNSGFLKVNKLADQKHEFQAPNSHSKASIDSKLADEIPPNSGFLKANKLADQKHEVQTPNSQHNSSRSSFMLRNSLSGPASAQYRPLDAKETATKPQQKASKPIQSCFRSSPPPLSSSTFPRQLKASANLQQSRRLKRNSLHAQLLEAREMENQKPASRGLIRFSPIRRAVSG